MMSDELKKQRNEEGERESLGRLPSPLVRI